MARAEHPNIMEELADFNKFAQGLQSTFFSSTGHDKVTTIAESTVPKTALKGKKEKVVAKKPAPPPSMANLTKYKKLFSMTRWGRCGVAEFNNEDVMALAKNRNDFVEQFNISSSYSSNNGMFVRAYIALFQPCTGHRIDHEELYRSKKGYVVVVSNPYGKTADQHYAYIRNGWEEFPSIYSKNMTTYVKVLQPHPVQKIVLNEAFRVQSKTKKELPRRLVTFFESC
jgi:hypothetical protein